MSPNRPKAYSYLRFSTPEQMRGDSFRRQTEAALAYAERHGLDLDTSLTFRDLGVSAYRGANVVEGALGQFIQAVDSGKVQPGSYLLVENLDRLSRDRVRVALRRFEDLLERDVVIVTLSDGKVWTKESLDNIVDLIVSLLTMSRAHEESVTKSNRIKAAWRSKKAKAAADGTPLTGIAPGWLRLDRSTGEFEVIKEHAAVVHRIFDETLAGHGVGAIAYRLNAEKVPHFGTAKKLEERKAARPDGGWYSSYVQKILRNEAVIGRFQPMMVTHTKEGKKRRIPDGPALEGYFPPIIEAEDFYRSRSMKPGARGGGKYPLANLLSGLVHCSYCGGKMHRVNKGGVKGNAYLACDNARRKGTCNAGSVLFKPVWVAVWDTLNSPSLSIQALMRAPKADRRSTLMRDKEAAEARKAEKDTQIANLLDNLATVRSSPAIQNRLVEYEAELAQLRKRVADLTDAIREMDAGTDAIGDLQQSLDKIPPGEFWQAPGSPGKERRKAFFGEYYVRLNRGVKRYVERIDVGRSGTSDGRGWNTPISISIKLHDVAEPQKMEIVAGRVGKSA